MNINQAKALARYHKFTKAELHQILAIALDALSDNHWKKPNSVNAIFDNGYYFNRCREWVGYKRGENDDESPREMIVVRVLQGFGKFSKVQIPKKLKTKVPIQASEKPTL